MSEKFVELLIQLSEQESLVTSLTSSDTTETSSPSIQTTFEQCQECMMSESFDPNSVVHSDSMHPYSDLPLIYCAALLTARVETITLKPSFVRKLFSSLMMFDDLDMSIIHSQSGCKLMHFVIVHCTTAFLNADNALDYFKHICEFLKCKDTRLSSANQSDSSLLALADWSLKDMIDGSDDSGFSPLWRAVETSQSSIARSLVSHFGLITSPSGIIDANRRNGPSQRTLAHLTFSAWPTSDPEAYRLIDEFSCKLGVLDSNGQMPLLLAQQEFREDCGEVEKSEDTPTIEPEGCGFEMFMALGPEAFEQSGKGSLHEISERGTIDLSSAAKMTRRRQLMLASLCPVYGDDGFKGAEFETKVSLDITSKCPFSSLHATMMEKGEQSSAKDTTDDSKEDSEDWKAKIPAQYRMFADKLTAVQIERVMKGQCPFPEFEQASKVKATMDKRDGCPVKGMDVPFSLSFSGETERSEEEEREEPDDSGCLIC